MRERRLATLLAGVTLLVLAAEPAAAQSSVNEGLINGLNSKLIYAAVPITVLVEGILIYTVWKYRASNQDEASPTQENRRLEITWTVATAIILLFVGFASYQVLASPYIGGASPAAAEPTGEPQVSQDYEGALAPSEPDALEVEVVAYKYAWEFHYPEQNVTSTGTLVVPKDRPVYFHITSEDWLHAFHVPALGWKQDAFPGQYNTVKGKALEEGEYQLYCAEYCGVGHSNMLGTVEVVSQSDFEDWVAEQKQS